MQTSAGNLVAPRRFALSRGPQNERFYQATSENDLNAGVAQATGKEAAEGASDLPTTKSGSASDSAMAALCRSRVTNKLGDTLKTPLSPISTRCFESGRD